MTTVPAADDPWRYKGYAAKDATPEEEANAAKIANGIVHALKPILLGQHHQNVKAGHAIGYSEARDLFKAQKTALDAKIKSLTSQLATSSDEKECAVLELAEHKLLTSEANDRIQLELEKAKADLIDATERGDRARSRTRRIGIELNKAEAKLARLERTSQPYQRGASQAVPGTERWQPRSTSRDRSERSPVPKAPLKTAQAASTPAKPPSVPSRIVFKKEGETVIKPQAAHDKTKVWLGGTVDFVSLPGDETESEVSPAASESESESESESTKIADYIAVIVHRQLNSLREDPAFPFEGYTLEDWDADRCTQRIIRYHRRLLYGDPAFGAEA